MDNHSLIPISRLVQLDAAIQMELWQEAYKAVEDIHGLMTLSKKVFQVSTVVAKMCFLPARAKSIICFVPFFFAAQDDGQLLPEARVGLLEERQPAVPRGRRLQALPAHPRNEEEPLGRRAGQDGLQSPGRLLGRAHTVPG